MDVEKMNVVERAKFCRDSAILKSKDNKTIEILRSFQDDPSLLPVVKIPISEWATAALIYLGIISYADNVSENADYILNAYSELSKEYKNGTLEL